MKKFLFLSMAVLTVLAAACNKDDRPRKGKYGVDRVTPMPEAVDLGIVVDGRKVLWASCNLGASNEYEYGCFLAWGETEEKDDYTWKTYKHAAGDAKKLTRYCPSAKWDYWGDKTTGPDREVTLLPSDDAAHVRLGGMWRCPTRAKLLALLSTLTDPDYSWTIETPLDKKGNEIRDASGKTVVRGWRIVSKKPDTEGNSIFIPFTGYYSLPVGSEELQHSIYNGNGQVTGLLSSSVYEEDPSCVYGLGFRSKENGAFEGHQGRSAGFPVRPVRYQ